MLRGQSIAHRHDHRIQIPGDRSAQPVPTADIAQHETAAVEVDDEGFEGDGPFDKLRDRACPGPFGGFRGRACPGL
jgi:hypothetical protein